MFMDFESDWLDGWWPRQLTSSREIARRLQERPIADAGERERLFVAMGKALAAGK